MRILIVMLISGACATANMSRPYTPDYAPADYEAVGKVDYLNQGADFIIKGRRNDAFKQMHENCNGSYKIIREGNEKGNSTFMRTYGNAITEFQENRVVIEFKCIKPKNNSQANFLR